MFRPRWLLVATVVALAPACSSEAPRGVCGDSSVDPGEQCDDGARNADGTADACRADCQLPRCGDGVRDSGEQCDDGNQDDGNLCASDCTLTLGPCDASTAPACHGSVLVRCVDGLTAAQECGVFACNASDGGYCGGCGDGVRDLAREACDDGNNQSGDGCDAACALESCGDGVVNDWLETCDDGAANSDTTPNACRSDCRLPVCGDGIVDDLTEECDDGSGNSDIFPNACRSHCRSPRCGDGVRDDLVEGCDDGNHENGDGCDANCTLPGCGNGIFDGTEFCGYALGSSPAVGVEPRQTVAVDLDGDGKLDLATVNQGSNDVSVLRGNGDGTFQAQVRFAAGPAPSALVAADFDLDGHVNLATTNLGDDSVSVLRGNGDGTFQAPATVAAGSVPVSMLALDVDLDGAVDLAVADSGNAPEPAAVGLLRGRGDGSFEPLRSFAAGLRPWGLAAGDCNDDGRPDLAVTDAVSNTARLLTADAAAYFVPSSFAFGFAGLTPRAAGLGDFDADGDLDLLVLGQNQDSAKLYFGDNSGSFPTESGLFGAGLQPTALAVSDLNGDGKLDALIANPAANEAGVLIGRGDGTFEARTGYHTGVAPVGVLSAELNGDGHVDIVATNTGDGTVAVMLAVP